MVIKHVITKGVEAKLTDIIIEYAKKNRLTKSNIVDVMKKVEDYMDGNAFLDKD